MEELASAKVRGHVWPDVGTASKGRSGVSEWLEGSFERKTEATSCRPSRPWK